MAPNQPRLRILSVGGNAVSAFLSWRLQATLACDVTLVWKSGFESVSQYGISFKSHKLGNERFKPHSVVRTPEDAAGSPEGFDYVLLCVKALPDVYDLATIIESVVSPHHTCIIINTTGSLGIEPYIESRFPTNVVLSLVSGVTVVQTGASEFEHTSSTDVWIGSANSNPNIPPSIQMDMAEALALTLASGNVECEVSVNIRQQQWEKMMGPIAFHPLSVLLETPNHPALMEKPGAKKLISDLLDELISIAKAQSCSFLEDFKQKTIEAQLQQSSQHSMMYQDFLARRPMEIETYLGSPIKSAQMVGVKAPHTESLYAILHHVNQTNQTRTLTQSSPQNPRSMQGPPRTQMNNMNNRRPPPPRGGPEMGMGPKRGPTPSMPTSPNQNGLQPNGHLRRVNGRNSPLPPSAGVSRRNSFENDLEEFGHIALYGDLVDSDELPMQQDGSDYGRNRVPNANDIAMRERELALRQRELALREQEMNMRQNAKPGLLKMRRKSRSKSVYDDDDDDEVYFDPPSSNTPMPPIDADNFDMMSVTSRRTRRAPSAGNLKSPGAEIPLQPTRPRHSMNQGRPTVARNRTSSRFGPPDGHGFHDPITENPLINYSSDRYGPADRKTLADTSRANSLTAQRLEDIRDNPVFADMGRGGAYPPHPAQQSPNNRRTSMGGPDVRQNGYGPRPGYPPNRGPPNGQPIRQQGQRHPQDQGLPHQVEPQVSDGVSQANPMKGLPNNRERSTTGSASASASNDSGSGISAGEHSAYSSSSSLERRQGLAVR